MADAPLTGSAFRARSKLGALRQQIQTGNFQVTDDIREFVNRYTAANPHEVPDKSDGTVNELISSVRFELGLPAGDQPGATSTISDQVRALVRGHAQASEDTARWAVHHAANQVTMYSGQFVYDAEDIFIDGAGMDFLFQRTYKSQGYYNGPLGINWDHNYNLWLRKVDGNQKIVRLTGGFQESTYVKHELHNYWVPPPGEHSIIIDISDMASRQEFGIQSSHNCHYGLRLSDGTDYFYEKDLGNPDPNLYRIKRIEDRFGNYLEFGYGQAAGGSGNRLQKVYINNPVNNPARVVSFEYDTLDRIIFIKDYKERKKDKDKIKGRIWRYTYDDLGDLIAFTTPGTDHYPEGLTERYVYSTPYYTGELQHNLVKVYDTAGRMYLENEYGTDTGLLSFNRVVRQREGCGERYFEYEDISLAIGSPVGQTELEEDWPAHQTVMAHRNGHPVHYIYNKFGNLIAREEDTWASGMRRRLVTHYLYNRDGALIGEVSPEGRITQYLYERDEFMTRPGVGNLDEDQLRQQTALSWKKRLSFGNRLAVVRRAELKKPFSTFQFPGPTPKLDPNSINPEDIIVKFTYDDVGTYQNIESVSDPRYTDSPFAGSPANPDPNPTNPDPNPKYTDTLTTFKYGGQANAFLQWIKYPNCKRDGQFELTDIKENFLAYDSKGRLTDYEDPAGTRMQLAYYPAVADPTDPEAPKEGYLHSQTTDPKNQNNPDGLNLKTEYEVNEVGAIMLVRLPKNTTLLPAVSDVNQVNLTVNDLNQVTKVTRTLKPGVVYETRYTYCRNMRVERIERDVQDENGQPLWGGTEVQFLHYDENDNVSRQQIGSPDFSDHLITHHTYDDGDLRVGTTLPRGNRIRISYDERRLPKKIERGVGSSEAVKVKVVYDGDGLLREQRDGRGLKTEFDYDSFGRVIETRDYDEQDNLYRLIRQDYDKAGNLTIERLFKPDGNAYKLLYHVSYRYDELNQRIENRLRRFQIPIAYTSTDVEKDNDDFPMVEAVRILYFYDKAGRPTRVEQHGRRLDINGQPQLQDTILASKYEYNSVGWLIAETDQLGNRTEMRYDKHALATRVDVREKVPLAVSPTGEEIFTTLYKYDDLDRLKSVTDGLGNVTRFEYDSRDTIICQEDPLGNITRFDYDIYGRQVAERIEITETGLGGGTRQPNSDIVTQYVYDASDNLIWLIDSHNTPTHQVYDALDRRIELRFVDGTATKYKYDGNDNVIWLQDNNGLIKETTYDPLDNPVRMDVDKNGLKHNLVVEGAMYEAFEYDALGQMTRAKNDWTDIYFEVDSFGRAYKESVKFYDQASVFTLKRAYDDFDFLTRLTYPNGRTLVYQADELNRIKRIENKAYGANYPGDTNLPQQRMILENTYRGWRIDRKSYGNGASTGYAYDGDGRIISISHRDVQNIELLTIQHLYDAAGNMRFKREFAPNDNYGEVYKYDSRSQLTLFQELQPSPTNTDRVNLKALAPVTSILDENQYKGQSQVINSMLGSLAQVHNQFTFKYDKLGNRLEERSPNQPPPINYTPNNLNQYTQRNKTQFFYNPSGNLRQEKTGATTRDYICNHRNQIVRVKEGGNLARFHFDALGRRVWSDTGGVKSYFLYDDENVIEEWRPAVQQPAERLTQYINEFDIDSRCLLAVSGEEFWYHKDLIGSSRLLSAVAGVQALTNNNQPIKYHYTPFGQLVGTLHFDSNPYLFSGRYYDGALDSYDFRARRYSPKFGRFFQRDTKEHEDSMNLFEYVGNNPTNNIDPLGTKRSWYKRFIKAKKATNNFVASFLQGMAKEVVRRTALDLSGVGQYYEQIEAGQSIREAFKKGRGTAAFKSLALGLVPFYRTTERGMEAYLQLKTGNPNAGESVFVTSDLAAKDVASFVMIVRGGSLLMSRLSNRNLFTGRAGKVTLHPAVTLPSASTSTATRSLIPKMTSSTGSANRIRMTSLPNKPPTPPTPIAPPIALGEIKGLRSYRHGLRQLSKREDIAGNTALATYDYSGQVHLQVFAVDAFGVRKIIWNGDIGRVTNLPRSRPGTRPFGDEMEPKVRRLVERATGQKYKTKPGNAPGPDILPENGH